MSNPIANIKSASYFVARIGTCWIPEYDKAGNKKMVEHPDWWGAVVLRNVSDAPQSTNLLIYEFETGKLLKGLPIVLPAKAGKVIVWDKKPDDEGINFQGLENKRLTLELDRLSPGSDEIQLTPTIARGRSPLTPLHVETVRSEVTKK